MTQNPQNGGNSPRMAGKRNISAVIMGEDIIEQTLEPGVLGGISFAHIRGPERIVLGKTRF